MEVDPGPLATLARSSVALNLLDKEPDMAKLLTEIFAPPKQHAARTWISS